MIFKRKNYSSIYIGEYEIFVREDHAEKMQMEFDSMITLAKLSDWNPKIDENHYNGNIQINFGKTLMEARIMLDKCSHLTGIDFIKVYSMNKPYNTVNGYSEIFEYIEGMKKEILYVG